MASAAGWTSLTLSVSEAASYGAFARAAPSVSVQRSHSRNATHVDLDVHSLTHVDFPWTVPDDEWRAFRAALSSRLGGFVAERRDVNLTPAAIERRWSAPRTFAAFVIDVSDLARTARQVRLAASRRLASLQAGEEDGLLSFEVTVPLTPRSVSLALNAAEYEQLMDALVIDLSSRRLRQEIASFLRASRDQPTMLLVRTGWDVFRPRASRESDLRHPLFDGFHPYLTHPYFAPESIYSFAGFDAVAADCPGLDCPAFDLDPELHPELDLTRRRVLAKFADSITAERSSVRPVQGCLLEMGRDYINNVSFPRSWGLTSDQQPSAECEVLATVLPLGTEVADSAPVIMAARSVEGIGMP